MTTLYELRDRYRQQQRGIINRQQGIGNFVNVATKVGRKIIPRGPAYTRMVVLHCTPKFKKEGSTDDNT